MKIWLTMKVLGSLLAATAVLTLLPMSVRADTTTYDFTGTLTSSFMGNSTVSGKFAIDFATNTVTSFDFTTPFGTVDSTNYTAFAFDIDGFLGLDFKGPILPVDELVLWFQTPVPFASAPLFTATVLPGPVAIAVPLEMSGGSVANCFSTTMPPGVCTTAGGSTFANGMAVSTTEPPAWALGVIGLILLVVFTRRRFLALQIHRSELPTI